jgi:hypothetical protein
MDEAITKWVQHQFMVDAEAEYRVTAWDKTRVLQSKIGEFVDIDASMGLHEGMALRLVPEAGR